MIFSLDLFIWTFAAIAPYFLLGIMVRRWAKSRICSESAEEN